MLNLDDPKLLSLKKVMFSSVLKILQPRIQQLIQPVLDEQGSLHDLSRLCCGGSTCVCSSATRFNILCNLDAHDTLYVWFKLGKGCDEFVCGEDAPDFKDAKELEMLGYDKLGVSNSLILLS